MGKRHKARELALKCLYAYDSVGEEIDRVCKNVIATSEMNDEGRDFAEALFRKVAANLTDLDSHIEKHCQNWDLNRLAMVDK
ncbi:MAG: transcription antitermination factor NusB, partial [bacterium]